MQNCGVPDGTIIEFIQLCPPNGGQISTAESIHSFKKFDTDADYQRSISFSILQIGELSGGLSADDRKETANRVQWGPIKGMRNLVAHNYGNMSREIIWETATVDIPVLEAFCNEQLKSYE